MTRTGYRALVVDDEELVRCLTIRALECEGFSCDAAGDGLQAQKMIDANSYDLVVTDLRMPKRNGHALAADLVANANHPVVVVVTGVPEPRLVRDLIERGVDAVEFKPVAHELLATKLKAMVVRREGGSRPAAGAVRASSKVAGGSRREEAAPAAEGQDRRLIDRDDIERKLGQLSKVLPVSRCAFDVFSMTSQEESQPDQIAAAIARDASLSVDVLRLANSPFYNAASRTVIELEEAVVRVGLKRVGELALATSALSALTVNVLPWMNIDLTWRRSIAAGVAVDLLLARARGSVTTKGLFLSAILQSMGRIVLGMLYPQQYQIMIQASAESSESLDDLEQKMFSLGQGQVMASLLKIWGIPDEIYEPLKSTSNRHFAFTNLAEPVRSKTELLKLSTLIANIAIGEWEPWDRIEFPPAPVLRRFGVESLSEIIEETRNDAQQIVNFQPQPAGSDRKEEKPAAAKRVDRQLPYCNLSSEPFDFLVELVRSMGIGLVPCDAPRNAAEAGALFNCMWSQPHRLAAHLNSPANRDDVLIVIDAAQAEPYARFGKVLSLPASYGSLCAACQAIAKDRAPAGPPP